MVSFEALERVDLHDIRFDMLRLTAAGERLGMTTEYLSPTSIPTIGRSKVTAIRDVADAQCGPRLWHALPSRP